MLWKSFVNLYAVKKSYYRHTIVHCCPFMDKKGCYYTNRLRRWWTILLNYNYKMKFQPFKKLSHAERQSRLIPKFCKPLEDTVIAAIRAENEIKKVRGLLITTEEIRIKSEKDDVIIKIKKQIRFKENNKKMNITGSNAFSLCNNVLMYTERIAIPASLQKFMLKEFHEEHSGISWMKSLMRCYTYWPKMDQNIEDLVNWCWSWALAAKSPPINFQPCAFGQTSQVR